VHARNFQDKLKKRIIAFIIKVGKETYHGDCEFMHIQILDRSNMTLVDSHRSMSQVSQLRKPLYTQTSPFTDPLYKESYKIFLQWSFKMQRIFLHACPVQFHLPLIICLTLKQENNESNYCHSLKYYENNVKVTSKAYFRRTNNIFYYYGMVAYQNSQK
jgi:hypothetical protein